MSTRIILISEEFYPLSNGTISCIQNILPSLTKKFNVELYTKFRGSINELENKNYTIIRPNNIFDKLFSWRKTIIQSGFRRGKTNTYLVNLFRLLTYPLVILNNRFGYISNKGWSNNIVKFIEKKYPLNRGDVIIAIGAPFSNVRSAINIKQRYPKILLMLLEFDLYTDNSELINKEDNPISLRIKRLSEEDNWFSISDKILVTDEMYTTLIESELGKWRDKIIKFKMPNLVDLRGTKHPNLHNNMKNYINIVYTGKFYSDIRNPDFALNTLSRVIKINPKIRLQIYGSGCEEIVEKYKKILKDNLIYHGQKSKEESNNAIYSADFLLNIGNDTITQAPSKIIEYISTGIPILNIYTQEMDISKEILKSYGLSMSVKENRENSDELINGINQFINKHLNSRVPYKDILLNYADYTPEFFSETIAGIIRKQNKANI